MSGFQERETEFRSLASVRGLKLASHRSIDSGIAGISELLSRLSRHERTTACGLSPLPLTILCVLFVVSLTFAHSLRTMLLHSAMLVLAIALSGRSLRTFLSPGLWVAYLFSLVMAAPVLLNVIYKGRVILRLSHSIGITRVGCLTAATFFTRTATSVTAVFFLLSLVRWTDLLRTLRSLRTPPIFVQVTGMTVSFLHLLLRQTHETHLGKKSRTICAGPLRHEYKWVGSRLANSWERSLSLMTDVDQAMTARGFTGNGSLAGGDGMSAREWAATILGGVFLLGVHFV